MNSILGLLTMCRKAGKLNMGMDMMKAACAGKTACGVYCATDISAKSLKEVRFVCGKDKVKLYSLGVSMDEIWADLGKRTGILAVCDAGFNKKAASMCEEISINADENGEQ